MFRRAQISSAARRSPSHPRSYPQRLPAAISLLAAAPLVLLVLGIAWFAVEMQHLGAEVSPPYAAGVVRRSISAWCHFALFSVNAVALAVLLAVVHVQRHCLPGHADLGARCAGLPVLAIALATLAPLVAGGADDSGELMAYALFAYGPPLVGGFSLVGWAIRRVRSVGLGVALLLGYAALCVAGQWIWQPRAGDPEVGAFIGSSILLGIGIAIALAAWASSQRSAVRPFPPSALTPWQPPLRGNRPLVP